MDNAPSRAGMGLPVHEYGEVTVTKRYFAGEKGFFSSCEGRLVPMIR
jgi:hypothetical protein